MVDITFSQLMDSTSIQDIRTWDRHLSIPEDAYEYGCYYENNNWYRDFYVYVNEQTISVKTLMRITADPNGGYFLNTRSIMCQNESSGTIQRIANGFSLAIDEQNLQPVVNAFKNELRNGLINGEDDALSLLEHLYDKSGEHISVDTVINSPNETFDFSFEEFIDFANIRMFDSSLLNYLYDFFLKEYGDIGNLYKYNAITRENGAYYITDAKPTDLASVLGGCVKDGTVSQSLIGLNSDGAYELINTLYNTDNEYINKIKNCACNRLAFRVISPTIKYVKLSGFEIENNRLDVSNNGQNMSCIATKVHFVSFYINGTDITINNQGTYSTPYNETFKNFVRTESLTYFGGDHPTMASELYNPVIDSIGFSGNLAPYTIIQNDYPVSNLNVYERYPNWVEEDNPTPVGDPDPSPSPVRIGVPDPTKIVDPSPSPQPDPPPEDEFSNVETSEINPPTTIGSLGSMYDLGTDNTLISQLATFLYDPLNTERICQIWKNDPTESIVSLHYSYIDPDTSGNPIIYLGNVSTNINAPKITSRYKTFNCGTRAIERVFKNSMDYKTRISIYLPFSGIHPLNTDEVMNSKITVKGTVDVLTGDILYQLLINRKKSDNTYLTDNKCLYTFTGNCKIDIPYSSSSLNMGGIGGTIGNLITGNLKGALGSAIGTATGGLSSVSSSGNLSGNTGAMGYKYPYLIIEYPKVLDVAQRGKLFGYETHKTVKLSQVSGYAEFERVHVDTISCSDEDRQAIEDILKSGVIL